ncbi:thioredoxin family protein [Sandarakinorhabdus sp.]|uniref:protein-disulfide reductase DsbD family protein n=1 Tax=Sandarakinorhabdus sp. TaxID=1916663 RepID=UPI00333EBD18
MIRILTLLFAAILAMPAQAQSVSDQPHTKVELIAASAAPAPGKPLTIGIALSPRAGWHTYWLNPGDAGAPTRAAWTLPAGTAAPADLQYPVPGTLVVSGLMNHVYETTNVLVTSVTPPAGLAPGSAFPVSVQVDWLVCSNEQCVPEAATLTLPLVIGNGAADAVMGPRISAAREALPKPLAATASWAQQGKRLVFSVPMAGLDKVRRAWFFPAGDLVINHVTPQAITVAGDALRIETDAADPGPSGEIAGVLRVEMAGQPAMGFAISAKPGAVPGPGAALAIGGGTDAGGGGEPGLALVLLGAVLGGLILNIMPCVFPILSLKALALAKGNVDAGKARAEALAYTAGVVIVVTALGGMVLALRAAGSQVGWAFQLQDPRVISFLLLLVTAIALNLAGLFEVTLTTGNLGQDQARSGGVRGSFFTGALAAFVATPCTGPFMAGALGAALVLPTVQALSIFAGLGFGLALPFLLIGFVPALRRRLPKPGAWMVRLRAILSVPMFLTALALAWVLGQQSGVNGMAMGLAGALLLGLFLWWLGAQQHGGKSLLLPSALSLATVVAATLLVDTGTPPASAAGAAVAASELGAVKYTPAALADLRSAGKPVFLYMTADWCLTCKVNEKGAMASSDVAASFKTKGITVMEGDWTRSDPAISQWLAEHKRAGVPVYVFYDAKGGERELPQILTVDELTSLAG